MPQDDDPGEGFPQGRETILVLEDEADLRILVTSLLERCGFTVLSAESGRAALEIWREAKEKIDLLLTDIVMPGMTGLEVAAKCQDERPDLKIVFMTGHYADLDSNGSMLVEGVNLVAKPYKIQNLAHAVRNRLDSRD